LWLGRVEIAGGLRLPRLRVAHNSVECLPYPVCPSTLFPRDAPTKAPATPLSPINPENITPRGSIDPPASDYHSDQLAEERRVTDTYATTPCQEAADQRACDHRRHTERPVIGLVPRFAPLPYFTDDDIDCHPDRRGNRKTKPPSDKSQAWSGDRPQSC